LLLKSCASKLLHLFRHHSQNNTARTSTHKVSGSKMITGIINWRAGCKIQGTTAVNVWSEENYNTSIMIMSLQS